MAKYNPKFRKKRSARKPLYLLLLLAAVVVAGLTWGTNAKYTREREVNDSVVKAKEFLFSSDLLKETMAEYTLNPGTGSSESVVFYVTNSDGMNTSQLAVKYEVTVYDKDKNEDNTVTVAYDVNPQELPAETVAKHKVTLSGLLAGKEYIVEAVGSNGYKQTLSAKFTVGTKDEGVYQNTRDMGEYIELTVWTHNVSGDVYISIPAGLVPDTTDTNLEEIGNYDKENQEYDGGNWLVGNFDAYNSEVYRFFKDGYQGGTLQATVGNKDAVETTPIE